HVLSAAEADALGAELDGVDGVVGRVRVGADAEAAALVAPVQERFVFGRKLRLDEREFALVDDAVGSVEGDGVAGGEGAAVNREALALVIDDELLAADDATLAPAAGDDGGVGGLAAGGCEDALGGVHATDVFGGGFLSDEDDLLALSGELLGV